MTSVIKLSNPATREFWEIPVVYEDEHLLAVNKPKSLLSSPDRYDAERPNLMRLLHHGIRDGKPWAVERKLTYLMNAHRLDFDTSGVMLLAKTKPVLVALTSLFGTEKPDKQYVALVSGNPPEDRFEVDAPIGAHPARLGEMRVDRREGKRARTRFAALERFSGWSLLACWPLTGRTHQIRVHLRHIRLPIAGDRLYGGRHLMLSQIKRGYRLKGNAVERPLISTTALHAAELGLNHPVTGAPIRIVAPWPRELSVAVKYLRRYALGTPRSVGLGDEPAFPLTGTGAGAGADVDPDSDSDAISPVEGTEPGAVPGPIETLETDDGPGDLEMPEPDAPR